MQKALYIDKPEIMTLEEVAEYLRISERTVYDWAQKGDLPCGKLGTAWRFKRSELEKWVDSNLNKPANDNLTPLPLNSILTAKRTIVIKEPVCKAEVLNTLIDSLSDTKEVTSRSDLAKGIFHREELMSTGIGMGIAVPHVRRASIKNIVMAVASIQGGIEDYDSFDSESVKLVFMIAAGQDQHQEHVKALSSISFKIKKASTRQAMIESPNSKELYKMFSK